MIFKIFLQKKRRQLIISFSALEILTRSRNGVVLEIDSADTDVAGIATYFAHNRDYGFLTQKNANFMIAENSLLR